MTLPFTKKNDMRHRSGLPVKGLTGVFLGDKSEIKGTPFFFFIIEMVIKTSCGHMTFLKNCIFFTKYQKIDN